MLYVWCTHNFFRALMTPKVFSKSLNCHERQSCDPKVVFIRRQCQHNQHEVSALQVRLKSQSTSFGHDNSSPESKVLTRGYKEPLRRQQVHLSLKIESNETSGSWHYWMDFLHHTKIHSHGNMRGIQMTVQQPKYKGAQYGIALIKDAIAIQPVQSRSQQNDC